MKKAFAKIMILATVIMMDLLTSMEFDIFIPSFPELQNHFNQSTSWTEALLSFNFAGYCLSLFFVGGLADLYGRKPIILLGLSVFIIGSILCLSTESYNLLLVGRFLQGIGVAAPAIISFLIISNTYPIKKQQFLIAMLNGSLNLAIAFAPIIGSYVTLHFHWQGNFTLLLLLALIISVITMIFIPNYKLPEYKSNSVLHSYISVF